MFRVALFLVLVGAVVSSAFAAEYALVGTIGFTGDTLTVSRLVTKSPFGMLISPVFVPIADGLKPTKINVYGRTVSPENLELLQGKVLLIYGWTSDKVVPIWERMDVFWLSQDDRGCDLSAGVGPFRWKDGIAEVISFNDFRTCQIWGKVDYKKIIWLEKSIPEAEMDLLSGKRVLAWGKSHQVGEGEGCYVVYDQLMIRILK